MTEIIQAVRDQFGSDKLSRGHTETRLKLAVLNQLLIYRFCLAWCSYLLNSLCFMFWLVKQKGSAGSNQILCRYLWVCVQYGSRHEVLPIVPQWKHFPNFYLDIFPAAILIFSTCRTNSKFRCRRNLSLSAVLFLFEPMPFVQALLELAEQMSGDPNIVHDFQ